MFLIFLPNVKESNKILFRLPFIRINGVRISGKVVRVVRVLKDTTYPTLNPRANHAVNKIKSDKAWV